MSKEIIGIEDFAKIDIRVGRIILAEHIEGSDKLLRLEVDFNEEKRQILSGIKEWYNPEELIGIKTLFLVNLAPRKMMGLESQGMLMAIDTPEDKPVIIELDEKVNPGDFIR